MDMRKMGVDRVLAPALGAIGLVDFATNIKRHPGVFEVVGTHFQTAPSSVQNEVAAIVQSPMTDELAEHVIDLLMGK